jgi:Flp pilus assembly pilin Flp
MTNGSLRTTTKARVYAASWVNTTAEALRRRRDRGQGAVEYLGIIILVALIIVAVVATNIDDTIANALRQAVDKVTNAGG